MKLFLASHATEPTVLKGLDTFVNGLAGKTIGYVPTALNGSHAFGSWRSVSSSWQTIQTLGAEVTPVELEEYGSERVLDILKGKDIIWFAGGMCGYLMYWVRRCGLDASLPQLLSEGSIYVGSSAGSMIATPSIQIGEWNISDSERGSSIFPGLGLVDFEIFPHYVEDDLEKITLLWSKSSGKDLYLLKDSEFIQLENDKLTVFGKTRKLSNTTK